MRAIELLREVDIPDPAGRALQYPHQFSGGMRQRAVIAMAMAGRPRLIIADEPTTSLDVTVQAQVLALLRRRQADTGAAVILITHDLGVIAEIAHRVAVMYAGRVVEAGNVEDIFAHPRHPYTVALLRSVPRIDAGDARLLSIPGQPPYPAGCRTVAHFTRAARSAATGRAAQARIPHSRRAENRNTPPCHFVDEVSALLAPNPVTAQARAITAAPDTPLLKVEGLSVHFPDPGRPAAPPGRLGPRGRWREPDGLCR